MTRHRPSEAAVLVGLFVLPIVNGGVAYLYSLGVFGPDDSSLSVRQSVIGAQIWTKFAVELGLVALLGLLVAVVLHRGRVTFPRLRFLLPLAGIMLVAQLVMLSRAPLLALAGTRVFLPVVFIVFAFELLDDGSLGRIEGVLVALAVLAAATSVVQLSLTSNTIGGVYGVYSLFAFPQAHAIFFLTVLTFLLARRERGPATLTLAGLCVAAVVVSQSGTGLLGLALLLAIALYRRLGNQVAVVAFATVPGVLVMLPVFTGRGSSIVRSAAIRGHILVETVTRMSPVEVLFGWGLGSGTNLSVTLVRIGVVSSERFVFIADSLYVSLLAQVGVVGLVLFVLFNLHILACAWTADGRVASVLSYLIPLVLLVGATNVVVEMFPTIWVYWLVVGLFLREQYGDSQNAGRSHRDGGPVR